MNKDFKKIIESYNDNSLLEITDKLFNDIKENKLTFNNKINKLKINQQGKIRKVFEVEEKSLEEISMRYLKRRIDRTFNITYPNRKKIMRQCFSTIETVSNFSDFVIYKFDFKDFFESVSSKTVLNKYIKPSNLFRFEKDILEALVHQYPFCFAGLPTSNALIEIISRDFDIILKSKLYNKGIIFYSRYVDDFLLIFNQFINEDELKNIIEETIDELFIDSDVNINPLKRGYICKSLKRGDTITYLGYEIRYMINNNSSIFKYGIDPTKIEKHRKKIKSIINDFQKDGNVELLRQRLLFFSSRVVFYNNRNSNYKKNVTWDVVGLIETYGELRSFLDKRKITDRTKYFLNDELTTIFRQEIGNIPYFLKNRNSSYLLENRMRKNKSIVFHPNIGWTSEHLVTMIKKIDPQIIITKSSYRKLVTTYCNILKIKRS